MMVRRAAQKSAEPAVVVTGGDPATRKTRVAQPKVYQLRT